MITVVIPALNESARISGVIELAKSYASVNDIIVIDDGSVDSTVEIATTAGARVLTSSLLGKGASMQDGLKAARNEFVVYLAGDLTGLRKDLIEILTAALSSGEADFVKARFSRSAGRVTTLTAKPLLELFFPEIAGFAQPLGGVIAGRASFLKTLEFETDYGVDLALLIDAQMAGARIVEVDIGHIEHDSQSLEALSEMARQVVRALLARAERYGRLTGSRIAEVEEVERHAREEIAISRQARGRPHRLAVFDMDGTLLKGRFVVELAKACGKSVELGRYLDNEGLGTEERSQRILELFAGTPKSTFENVARQMELNPSAAATVVELRRLGFTVGIVSDSYRIATEIVRRRVFADFSVANLIRFVEGKATRSLTNSPLLQHPNGCALHTLCKQNVVVHLKQRFGIRDNQVLVVGDGANDVCMLRSGGLSIAYEPRTAVVAAAADHVVEGDLAGVLAAVREKGWDLMAKGTVA